MTTNMRALRGAALVLSALLLSGCTVPFDLREVGSSGGVPAAAPAPDAPVDAGAPLAPAADENGRHVERTASVTLQVRDVLVAADAARDLAARVDGWVADESIRLAGDGDSRVSTVTLSVPASRLDEAMALLSELGEVHSRSTSARDVTSSVVDIDARIRALEASITRVQALMERAGSLTEVAQVERELTQRQSELESLRARQAQLQTSVERASLFLALRTDAPPPEPNPFLDGLMRGWYAFLGSVGLLLALLGGALPFALVGLLILGPLAWRWRRRSAARRDANLAGAGGNLGGVHVVARQPQSADREQKSDRDTERLPHPATGDEDEQHGRQGRHQVEG